MTRSLAPSSARVPRRRRVGAIVAALAVPVVMGGLAACEPLPAAPAPSGGTTSLWISPGELSVLPTSGTAWTDVVRAANADWGTPSLSDNNATHDTSTLAGALVAARTGNATLKAKTRAAIMSVTRVTTYSRVLELSRNITDYVIAADIIDLPASDKATFKAFISALRTKPLAGHSGGYDMVSTALLSPNNWGAMARAATTAIDLYIGDRGQLDKVANAHRAWLGENVPNTLKYTSTAWHASSSKAGINRRGSVILGRSADGVEPEDQRRTGEPTTAAAPKGTYPWEALQGALVTGVLLDRAGIVDINAGDKALTRAFTWLITVDANPPAADDEWQPWVINRVAGTRFAAAVGASPGKNMAWTDWTHGPHA